MKTVVSDHLDFKKYYLSEFQHFDGESFITFNIVGFNLNYNEITVAVTRLGKISILNYDLYCDKNGYYFEYGCSFEKIRLTDFQEIENETNPC